MMRRENELWPELAEKLDKESEEGVTRILVTSAKQLRFGSQQRRDLHRYVVEMALSELAERHKE